MTTTDNTLQLASAPSVLLLFGLAGSGKSYIGDLMSRLTGWHVYHADEDITEEMRLALAEHRPFTDEMRDRYFSIVVDRIRQLQQKYNHLLVTQAVYKQRHRDYLVSQIPQMELIHVQADEHVIETRLQERAGEASAKSAAALRKDFESPTMDYKVLKNNNGDMAIVRQLNAFYADA
ncbi:MAG: AAA family ATPase [Gammaproteobacteria bacterium]|nr:AAA family ATPase [Gammaproteobacteria bacterium]